MAIQDEAKQRLMQLHADVQPEYLWKTKMPFLGEQQTVCLFGLETDEGFGVAAVAQYGAEPWVLAAPNWDSLRKGKRERELDVLELYLGHTIYAKRTPGAATDKMLAFGERKRLAALKHPQADSAELVEVVHIKGFGGNHTVVSRRMYKGRLEYVSKSGRVLGPNAKILPSTAAHAMWMFLAKENLPTRRWNKAGWG